MLEKTAIIVAGGTGSRMNSEVPKQFLLLNGLPVLMHSIQKFASENTEIIVVLHSTLHEEWRALCKKHNFSISHTVAEGGRARSESVYNGLKISTNIKGLVAVHDAARPLVSKKLVHRLYEVAAEKGNAIPVTAIKDSVRIINGEESKSVDRSVLRAVQTPQVFKVAELKAAFENCISKNIPLDFSDEASLMEFSGGKIILTEGEQSNIKLTYACDLHLAEVLLKEVL